MRTFQIVVEGTPEDPEYRVFFMEGDDYFDSATFNSLEEAQEAARHFVEEYDGYMPDTVE